MAAAFRVKYRGPTGDCPDAVVIFDGGYGECAAELATQIKQALVKPRGGHWQSHDVMIREIVYIGPWFDGDDPATPA